jgi:hypothetical protein
MMSSMAAGLFSWKMGSSGIGSSLGAADYKKYLRVSSQPYA